MLSKIWEFRLVRTQFTSVEKNSKISHIKDKAYNAVSLFYLAYLYTPGMLIFK